MEAFVRAVELGGFSAAARELKLTPSTLSKLVTRLESGLKVRLLARTTRRLALTPEGELFLARCRRVLAELEDAESEVGRRRAQPRGALRLQIGVGFATHVVVPALPRFLAQWPEVQVELIVEDRDVDLVREGIDISVRPGPPRDPSLVARNLGEFERIVCASPAYIARRGMPRSPAELVDHDCITLARLAGRSQWPFVTPEGRQIMQINPRLSATNNDSVLQFALMGLGIVHLNDFIVGESLGSGRLVRVLADFHCPDRLPMHAQYPPDRHRLPRVALMLDFLAEAFAKPPWRGRPTASSARAAPSGRRARARRA
ncbi:MAG: LysR family transcriptional regulator [Clostridia bacterium]